MNMSLSDVRIMRIIEIFLLSHMQGKDGTMRHPDNLEHNQRDQKVSLESQGCEKELAKSKGRGRRLLSDFIQLSTIAWTMIANVATGVFLGYWADRLLGTQPVLTITLSLLGVFAAIRYLFHFSRRP